MSFSSGIIYRFADTQAGQISEVSISVSSVGGNVSGVSAQVASPFKFKGGAYPGVGGTCSANITESPCLIVLNFEPSAAGTFAQNVQFNYSGGSSNLSLTGQASLPPPTDLAISGPSSVEKNQCISFVLNSIIQPNINSPVLSNTTVNLAINSGSGSFYSDITCNTPISSQIISNGSSSATVYFKSSTAPQTPTLVASSTSLQSGTKVISVASTPVKLSLNAPAQIQVNDCRLITVARVDSSNIAVSSLGTVTVNLSTTNSALTYADSSCTQNINMTTIASGNSSASFYVADAVAQSFNLQASDNSATLSSDSETINAVTSLQWWNTSFKKRIQILVDNSDQSVSFSNQAVLIKLNSSIAAYSNFNSDGSDIRFVADDHTTVLSHEVEKWDVNGNSYIWVKVPSIPASSSMSIYMYFGNSTAAAAEDAHGVWSRYSSVWHLKESPSAAAPQFKDSTSAGKNGTAENSPTSINGIIGNALDFNGSYDDIDVGSLNSTLGSTATLSFWIKTNQTGNNTNYQAPGVTGIEEVGGANDIFWGWIDATGYIAVTAGNGTGAKSNLAINDNVWRHITISRSSANGGVSFYVNGVLNSSGTSGVGDITTNFSKFGVIPTNTGVGKELNGALDEIRIISSVMTADDVKADFKFQNNSQLSFGSIESIP